MEFKDLQKLVQELIEDGRVKLVEGKKDRAALESFGMCNVVEIRGPLQDLASQIKGEVILLTDFDRKGRALSKRLIELFENEGVKVDLLYKKEIGKTGIKEIAEFRRKFDEIRGDINGKNLHRHGKVHRLYLRRDRRHS